MSALRDEAEAVARALEVGVCSISEAIAWSDAQVIRQESPPVVLYEVSLSQGRYPQDVARLLRQIPGTPDRSQANQLLLTLLHDRWKRDPGQAGRVSGVLYEMAIAEELDDPDLERIAWWAWIAFDPTEYGSDEESREQVDDQLLMALDRAATKESVSWSYDPTASDPNG